MTWWQGLIVAGVPALLTLLVTRAYDDRRFAAERADRERDREYADAVRESEKRTALQERWRDERKAAHVALVTTLRNALDALVHVWTLEGLGLPVGPNQELEAAHAEARACIAAARNQVSEVELIGSTLASERARQAVLAFRGAYGSHGKAQSDGDPDPRNRESLRLLINDYLLAVRQELGTELV